MGKHNSGEPTPAWERKLFLAFLMIFVALALATVGPAIFVTAWHMITH